LLVKAGVAVCISSNETYNARKLRQVAGNAVRAGMKHEDAIRAITSAPADAFGLGAKVGTLKKGKVANVVVWTGDPLELSTEPALVIIRGKKTSLRTRQTELFEKYRKLPPKKSHEPIQ
ncbi:MAG TPA: amidohydrolase family protein, partial [Polyangiaceae bacterium]|nr:amidohydrolase family protein [Polyangiaceae bacterium]